MIIELIIVKVVKGDIDKNVLMEYLIDDFDCEKIDLDTVINKCEELMNGKKEN